MSAAKVWISKAVFIFFCFVFGEFFFYFKQQIKVKVLHFCVASHTQLITCGVRMGAVEPSMLIFYHVRSDGGSESRCTDHLDFWSKLPEDKSLEEFERFAEARWKQISRYFYVSIMNSVLLLQKYCTFSK